MKGSFTRMEIDPRYYFLGRIKLHSDASLDVDFLQLAGFRYLWFLSLRAKKLKFVHATSFDQLKSLKHLELYDAAPSLLEQLSFEKLSEFTSLSIHFANLTRFSLRNITTATNLTSLTLQNVHLKSEDVAAFASFTKLKKLKISKSKLESFSYPGFLPLTLQSLTLSKVEDTIFLNKHGNCSVVAVDCNLRIGSGYDVTKAKLDVSDSLVTMETCHGDRGSSFLRNSFVRYLDSNCRSQCFAEP